MEPCCIGHFHRLRFSRGGQLRVLASFEARSSIPGIPDARSLGQPELDQISVERLVGAPPGLPAPVQTVLAAALAKALQDPVVTKWAKENDLIMVPRAPEATAKLVAEQRAFFDKWRKYLVTG